MSRELAHLGNRVVPLELSNKSRKSGDFALLPYCRLAAAAGAMPFSAPHLTDCRNLSRLLTGNSELLYGVSQICAVI